MISGLLASSPDSLAATLMLRVTRVVDCGSEVLGTFAAVLLDDAFLVEAARVRSTCVSSLLLSSSVAAAVVPGWNTSSMLGRGGVCCLCLQRVRAPFFLAAC